jgi:hypothetical protein
MNWDVATWDNVIKGMAIAAPTLLIIVLVARARRRS